MDSELTDQTFVRGALSGDLDAFNQLVLKYQDSAFGYANAQVGDPDLAEDVTQESFIKAFQKLRYFQGGSFRAWLITIVANTARDRLRQLRRHQAISLYAKDENGEEFDTPLWLVDPSASVEETVLKNEETHYLHRLVDALPAVYRTVITLIDLYEFNYAEAAAIMNVPLGTVKSRLARARTQLRDAILLIVRPAPDPFGQFRARAFGDLAVIGPDAEAGDG
jgi:RNA polymerase sigma-70 factor (ECF subfamily)